MWETKNPFSHLSHLSSSLCLYITQQLTTSCLCLRHWGTTPASLPSFLRSQVGRLSCDVDSGGSPEPAFSTGTPSVFNPELLCCPRCSCAGVCCALLVSTGASPHLTGVLLLPSSSWSHKGWWAGFFGQISFSQFYISWKHGTTSWWWPPQPPVLEAGPGGRSPAVKVPLFLNCILKLHLYFELLDH